MLKVFQASFATLRMTPFLQRTSQTEANKKSQLLGMTTQERHCVMHSSITPTLQRIPN